MNLSSVTMDKTEARKAFLEYQEIRRGGRESREDLLIEKMYREISKGKMIIDLGETITAGGMNEYWMPRLAVARADQTETYLERFRSGTVTFSADQGNWQYDPNTLTKKRTWLFRNVLPEIPESFQESLGYGQYISRVSAKANVPSIPPRLRPNPAIDNFTILWEAEWEHELNGNPPPPIDPALLRHLGGDMYGVVAVWDLTEIERSVLGM